MGNLCADGNQTNDTRQTSPTFKERGGFRGVDQAEPHDGGSQANGGQYGVHVERENSLGKGPMQTTYPEVYNGRPMFDPGNYNKAGQKEGPGVLQTKNGDTIEGSWRAGQLHGPATITYLNGDLFTGTVINGKAQGSGLVKTSSGSQYFFFT